MRRELPRPARVGAAQPIFVSTAVRHVTHRAALVTAAALLLAAAVVVLALLGR